MKGVKVVGFGHYCPDNIVSNKDLESIVETTDEWIVKRTGIKERRISSGEGTVELAYKAALSALKNSNCDKDDIDLIVVATTSPDKIMPSTACSVQGLLGCNNAAAFDISAACSGFVYSLIVASSLIRGTDKKRALVIGSEVLSRIIDWSDRSTCVLFGDGAGAAVIEISNDEEGIISTCFSSDGSLGEKSLVAGELELNTPFAKDKKLEKRYIEMKGAEVYKFAVSIIPQIVNELLEKSNEDIKNIKYIVPHQANSRIIDDAARRLKVDKDKFYINLDKYGNTSSASIPVALSEMFEKGLIKRGDKIILAAFGGGLTWAGTLIKF
ncbi:MULTISPECIES: beta-ketoacyl-ACP synthase III [Clostridium]|jgi:3-oxoacyl-[acyl-carrier-protein] synthase-3|uniref:beta-ketoacyl-ACP synthase III n=1 Tax=Clostridium TaxID=1485 RepID=UPI00019B019B|nr:MULTISPECIES: beta-ketoacyl-ACP synthase III [Clostridium]EEH98726.1 3-oxoacyl-[acyl-carrier-protein] synthase 3 [Clostridium sp. 7_2_43FAA]MBP1868686.1 3-oxoacyl-[acyl-carrier-protein] synthase-3 [Clostridium tertium]MBU6136293.1 ketoacyl-ACP synthase III [Clostridium tertium]MDB1940330.1 ketoacyl-ACP synthase III [Clostridium tertium]MDB1946710.1 ketoacyl-ACP synthase III [Clostridium tertium]